MSIAVMKQALEFIAGLGRNHWGNRRAVMDAIRAAIAEAEKQAPYIAVSNAVSNDRIKIDPVTGDVSIGTPAQPAPVQEPVAWISQNAGLYHGKPDESLNPLPLYLVTPPAAQRQEQYDQTALELCEECGWRAMIPGDGCLVCARQKAPRKWVGLTDEEMQALWDRCAHMEMMRAIEAKLKEKNT
jgi:predicted Fe-S protein YdhL (DUF1289 family)